VSFRIRDGQGDLTDTEPALQSALGPPSLFQSRKLRAAVTEPAGGAGWIWLRMTVMVVA